MNGANSSLWHRFDEGDLSAPVLLLLHGTGGGPEDLRGLGSELSPASAQLAPRGPVAEAGSARWFRRLAVGVFDRRDVVYRAHQLADFVLEARSRHRFGSRSLVAVGFSHGANIAAAVALLRPDAVRSAVLFASILPLSSLPEHDLSATRVFLSSGARDPHAPLDSAGTLVAALRRRGAVVQWSQHPGGHQITAAGRREAKEWLEADSITSG